jgi:Amt family ammonium transporter
VPAQAEKGGVDLHEHAETGYDVTASRGGIGPEATPPGGLHAARRSPTAPAPRTAPDPAVPTPIRVEHPARRYDQDFRSGFGGDHGSGRGPGSGGPPRSVPSPRGEQEY